MDKKIIDDIVWWIPFKNLRNSTRTLLLELTYNLGILNNYATNNSKEGMLVNVNNELIKANSRLDKIDCFLNIYEILSTHNIDFYGQIGQDLIAYLCFKNKKDGFFLDIGANDGITDSNTYLFEKLGWRGACVEANPNTFKKLQENRKCNLYNNAVTLNNIGKAKFIASAASGLDVLEMHNSELQKTKLANAGISELEYMEVDTITFSEIMSDFKDVTHIDFMSLDIEGGEIDVLKSIDFNKYSFGLITIEFSGYTYQTLIDIMVSKGYKLLIRNNFDLMFVRDRYVGYSDLDASKYDEKIRKRYSI